jgi:hypothetical protein
MGTLRAALRVVTWAMCALVVIVLLADMVLVLWQWLWPRAG